MSQVGRECFIHRVLLVRVARVRDPLHLHHQLAVVVQTAAVVAIAHSTLHAAGTILSHQTVCIEPLVRALQVVLRVSERCYLH